MKLNELKRILSVYSLPPVILCIGSTKIIGDSYGPMVGQLLKDTELNAIVYGSLESPITALNVTDVYNRVKAEYPLNKIIAIDAFSGDGEHDELKLVSGGIKPGLASGKDLPRIGDVSIIASSATFYGNHSLSNVYRLAQLTVQLLKSCIRNTDIIP